MLRNFLFNLRMSFRIWMRNRTKPVTIEEAEEKKLFWAKIYMLCGCGIFIMLTRSALQDPSLRDFSASLPVAKKLIDGMGDNEFRVMKFSGFTKISDQLMTKEEAYKIRDAEIETSKNKS